MNAARQACRPKHQVLVLKCYPKFQKKNAEVKANSSELSYLLYYASTRRSKLQKLGDFLDKRTTADVWKSRVGYVQVTLEILKALIEKCPQNLPLYASAVLRILRTILKSDDVTMVEESVPTFESLCAHQDPATLAADQDYIKQYEEIVQLYAQFASKEVVKHNKAPISWPVAIRFRKAGLQALKAIASSESLGSDTGRQLAVIIPVILLNIYSETGDYLRGLERREREKQEQDKEKDVRRRQSVSTVRTIEDEEGDPIAASGTTEDADKLAEEEVGIVALQAIRNIFVGVNRVQLRLATSAVLKFIGDHVKPQQHSASHATRDNSWATTLLAMACGWARVQDRYAILVGTMETLVRSPITEEDMERQMVLATVIDYLLRSTINFIGLSVMDVMIGLISHTLLLLQLGGAETSIKEHHQQTTPGTSEEEANNPRSSGSLGGDVVELVKEPSQHCVELLDTLQKCMSSLATHVYYTDQISDMVAAILSRLKPPTSSGLFNNTAGVEDPVGAIDAVATSAGMDEKTPQVDKFFSFETARLTALEAVKDIIITANTRRPDGSSASVSRSSVDVRVWEGTQWLLRDPSGKVRRAYVDTLITWLNLEKRKVDLRVVEDHHKKENDKSGLARRAVSNASARDKSPKRDKNKFLALLHLAVYENALQYVDSEADFLLLHLLLATLVDKLGVNAIRSGLPMILRLQEDIQSIDSPGTKILIGSLVHGYLWAVSMALDFETSSVGRALHSEISRRNNKGLWVKQIRVPPTPLDRIDIPNSDPVHVPAEVVESEALQPFDNRSALVDKISEGYSSSLYSPPSSPPTSPGRSISVPTIAPQASKPAPQLPAKVKEEMMTEWTKANCVASNTKDSSSPSVTGSRAGTSAHGGQQKNNYLGITIPNGNLDSATNSPLHTPRRSQSRPPSTAYGLVGRMHSPNRAHSPSATPGSTSSVRSAVRVEDLKRVLSGKERPRTSYSTRPASHYHRASPSDSSASDSMVSVHSLSDSSFVTAEHGGPHTMQSPGSQSPSTPAATLTPRPLTSHPPDEKLSSNNATRQHDQAFSTHKVPPVPPIPASLRENSVSPSRYDANGRPKTAPHPANGNGSIPVRKSRSVKRGTTGTRSVNEGSGSRNRSGSVGNGTVRSGGRGRGAGGVKKPDFSGFLDSIGVDGENEGEDGERRMGRAPY